MDLSVPAHLGIKETSDKSLVAVGLPQFICVWRLANWACKLSICCRNNASAMTNFQISPFTSHPVYHNCSQFPLLALSEILLIQYNTNPKQFRHTTHRGAPEEYVE
jgi:hypothetical protein